MGRLLWFWVLFCILCLFGFYSVCLGVFKMLDVVDLCWWSFNLRVWLTGCGVVYTLKCWYLIALSVGLGI